MAKFYELVQAVREATRTSYPNSQSADVEEIARRVQLIQTGHIVQDRPMKTYTREHRPFTTAMSVDATTDPEPAAVTKEPTQGCATPIYADLGLSLVGTLETGEVYSIPVGHEDDFTGGRVGQYAVASRNMTTHSRAYLMGHFLEKSVKGELLPSFDLRPDFDRLLAEWKTLRNQHFAEAKKLGEKHAAKLNKARARDLKPENVEKRKSTLRVKGTESLAKELTTASFGYIRNNYTPEKFLEMMNFARDHFNELALIDRWRRSNKASSAELHLEDVQEAFNLASVKDVHQS